MDHIRWFLHSPVPSVAAFLISIIISISSHFSVSNVDNNGGTDLLAGTLPSLSTFVPWFWIATITIFIMYAGIGKFIRSRW